MIRFCHISNSWQRLRGFAVHGNVYGSQWCNISVSEARGAYDAGCKVLTR